MKIVKTTLRKTVFLIGLTGFGWVVGMSATSADIPHSDDVIIDGSLNVGLDSVINRNFGFDTVILSENNLRILFEDTSSSASFPSNDWRIRINDSSNGGGNYYAIEDVTGGRTPFRIEAGAPNNSLYVEDDGDVGIGTSTPVVNIHAVDGDTPTMRLEQNGSSGFTPQTWDLAGNETNFFLRDVTNGSRLPLRVRPGAPTSSIDIANDGDIGIGTSSPVGKLHVENATGNDFDDVVVTADGGIGIGTDAPDPNLKLHVVQSGTPYAPNIQTDVVIQDTDSSAIMTLVSANANNGQINFGDIDNDLQGRLIYFHGNDQLQIFVGGLRTLDINSSGNTIEHSLSSAHLTAAGVWMDSSSQVYKENIQPLTLEKALDTVMALDPMTYNYKIDQTEGFVGFIAEDVPDLVATNDRKSMTAMDVVAVLTKVVQNQEKAISQLNMRLEELTRKLKN